MKVRRSISGIFVLNNADIYIIIIQPSGQIGWVVSTVINREISLINKEFLGHIEIFPKRFLHLDNKFRILKVLGI